MQRKKQESTYYISNPFPYLNLLMSYDNFNFGDALLLVEGKEKYKQLHVTRLN